MVGLVVGALVFAMICAFSEMLAYEPRKKDRCKSSEKHCSELLTERNKRRASLSDEH